MYKELIEAGRGNLEKAVLHFREEISRLRTGRATSALLDGILVDYYGTKTPLKQMAGISVPEARTIVVSPWDKSALASVEKAIRESQLNLNPLNDGQVLRLTIPALTEERRRELVKILNQEGEKARIAVRKIREDIWETIQELEKDGKMSEDDKFAGKEALQKTVDEYNGRIEETRKKKEEEIMTV